MIEIMSKSHIYKLKVFVEDVDFGRVFYSRYLQYIERARTELIHQKFNLSLTQLMNEHDLMFVVRTCNIKYLKSAVFEDKSREIGRFPNIFLFNLPLDFGKLGERNLNLLGTRPLTILETCGNFSVCSGFIFLSVFISDSFFRADATREDVS